MSRVKLINGDCMEAMAKIDIKVDLILADLPYGTTQNKWDSVLNLKELWGLYNKLPHEKTAIVLTAAQPFATELIMSNKKEFRYDLIWNKIGKPTGFLNAKRMPLRSHEHVLIFYKALPTYNPQKTIGRKKYSKEDKSRGKKLTNNNYGEFDQTFKSVRTNDRFPLSVLNFAAVHPPVHPTEKPVDLMRWLIMTYSNKGDTVLDNTMGSGTTGVAAMETGRRFIGIEKDTKYFNLAADRITKEENQLKMFT